METFLLLWNPTKYDWENDSPTYEELRTSIILGNETNAIREWSCGRTKSIRQGDRVFMLMTGDLKHAGIVASGYAITDARAIPHFDPILANNGEMTLSIKVQFDKILDVDNGQAMLRTELLTKAAGYNWYPFRGGLRIPQEVAVNVESEWKHY